MIKKTKPSGVLVYGIGFNDSSYQVNPKVNGKHEMCPIYSSWANMLYRYYSGAMVSYSDCYVCEEWLIFTKFKSWMEEQEWQGKQLDKDILVQGNRVYSPIFCVFVSGDINKLLIDGNASKTGGLKGVSLIKSSGRYRARGSDSKGNKSVSLGCFETEIEAHEAYKDFRYKVIRELALTQDEPIKLALLNYVIV